jgi:hypothetical protein
LKLDVGRDARLRMPGRVIAEIDEWLEREALVPWTGEDPNVMIVAVELVGRDGEDGYPAVVTLDTGKMTGRGKSRRAIVETAEVMLNEYPPRCAWWYMTEGKAK